jgi:hypothetical protein
MEINLDIVSAERVFVQLESALDDAIEVDGFFLRRGGPGEFKKILDDARGAACLTMRQFELAFGGFVLRWTISKQFRDAENSGERVVELVRNTGEHLAHGGELFRLDELFLEPLEIGDIAPRKDHAFDFSGFIRERAEIEADTAPLTQLVTYADFERGESLAPRQNIGE